MRLAKPIRTLLQLTLLGTLAVIAVAKSSPNITPSRVRDQLNQPAATGAQQTPSTPAAAPVKPQPKAAAPVPTKAPAPAKSASAPVKTPVSQPKTTTPAKLVSTAVKTPVAPTPVTQAKAPVTAAKAPPQAPAKAPAKPATQDAASAAAKPPAEKPADEAGPVVRRDPFDSLLVKARPGNGVPENLPPGKAGLMVSTVQITGIVHDAGGMIAIVANPQQRVYFLREGDKLYDGTVDHITLEAVSFHETGKDAFGKPIERQVTKRLYPTPGEEQ